MKYFSKMKDWNNCYSWNIYLKKKEKKKNIYLKKKEEKNETHSNEIHLKDGPTQPNWWNV